ncbi:unnamed protein product [Bursaphelenchus okinawaensis]|uniref:Uncharacterized protein n=1 Tax=Bursaphelenchus okinawaensis TaxID=465554 RepID=A0A811KTD1_9BILA|nr:unnamed protein product [Bursaphelenchus okinawaensis]CAG9109316.1 unnamed protein product [Bursaphelenchus okinawaensis]
MFLCAISLVHAQFGSAFNGNIATANGYGGYGGAYGGNAYGGVAVNNGMTFGTKVMSGWERGQFQGSRSFSAQGPVSANYNRNFNGGGGQFQGSRSFSAQGPVDVNYNRNFNAAGPRYGGGFNQNSNLRVGTPLGGMSSNSRIGFGR